MSSSSTNGDPTKGFTRCQDGHHCYNGSLCTENPFDEGSFYCDCEESFLDNTVSGLSCEHVATEYCTFSGEISKKSFCTNHGTCNAKVGVEEAHLGCNCPSDYEGEHCQFVRGTTRPNNWPGGEGGNVNWGASSKNEKLSGGVTAVIVLICLGLVGAVGFLVYKRQRSSSSGGVVSSPEFELDADGNVLQSAVESGGVHKNGTLPEFELDADGSVLKDAVKSTTSPTAAITADNSMEDVDVASPTNGDDENGGGGLV